MRTLIVAWLALVAWLPVPLAGQAAALDMGQAQSMLDSCARAVETRAAAAEALTARADALWRPLVAARPDLAAPRVGRARVLLQCQLPLSPVDEAAIFYEAEQLLREALVADSTYWPARFVLGNALARAPEELGYTGDAIAQIEAVLVPGVVASGRAERADAWLLLGDLYRRSGRAEVAVTAWRRGLYEFGADGRFRARLEAAGVRP